MSFLLKWNKPDKCHLKILTLASKIKHENGGYEFNFDAIKNAEYGRIKEIRGKEDKVYEELDCIAAPCSGDIEMELKDKKCQFIFTVSGALKPSAKLEKGEDVLEYNDSMTESRRHLHLTPTYDEASEGRAYIKFWVGENVKHTVTICGVPVEKTKKMSSSTLSRHSSDASSLGSSQTFTKSVDEEDHTTVDAGSVRNATVRATGPGMTPAGNQALPVYPTSTQGKGPTYVPASASADGDEEAEGAICGETAYDKILTHASLQCLASFLSPAQSRSLLIYLKVPSVTFDQKMKDNPHDSVSAVFYCFLYWKEEASKSDQINISKLLYEDLIAQLEAISRRDIKSIVMKALNDNKELEKGDFKRL